MGVQLVSLAFENWSAATDRPFRALVYMCLTALDTGNDKVPPATYFGGWPAIAEALGLEDPKGNPAKQTVDRLMAKLVRLGAIERIQSGRPGENAVYKLHVQRRPRH